VLHAPHAPFMAGMRTQASLSDSTAYAWSMLSSITTLYTGYLAVRKLLLRGAPGQGRDVLHAPHAPFMAVIWPHVSLSASTADSVTELIWTNRIVQGSIFEHHLVWGVRRDDKGIATQLAECHHLTALPRFTASQTYESTLCET